MPGPGAEPPGPDVQRLPEAADALDPEDQKACGQGHQADTDDEHRGGDGQLDQRQRHDAPQLAVRQRLAHQPPRTAAVPR